MRGQKSAKGKESVEEEDENESVFNGVIYREKTREEKLAEVAEGFKAFGQAMEEFRKEKAFIAEGLKRIDQETENPKEKVLKKNLNNPSNNRGVAISAAIKGPGQSEIKKKTKAEEEIAKLKEQFVITDISAFPERIESNHQDLEMQNEALEMQNEDEYESKRETARVARQRKIQEVVAELDQFVEKSSRSTKIAISTKNLFITGMNSISEITKSMYDVKHPKRRKIADSISDQLYAGKYEEALTKCEDLGRFYLKDKPSRQSIFKVITKIAELEIFATKKSIFEIVTRCIKNKSYFVAEAIAISPLVTKSSTEKKFLLSELLKARCEAKIESEGAYSIIVKGFRSWFPQEYENYLEQEKKGELAEEEGEEVELKTCHNKSSPLEDKTKTNIGIIKASLAKARKIYEHDDGAGNVVCFV